MRLTLDQVTEMAPDAGSAAAGKKLMATKNWKELGCSSGALWGLCQGSALYQVKVDLSNLGYNCSCPSRKFPCKHTLGLLMLFAASADAVPQAAAPEWVSDWLARRRAKAEKKPEKEAEVPKPVDQKAEARRAERRDARVRDGVELLDLWLNDLVRNGLAGLETKTAEFWGEQAKRLVDAQAPGLASRVARWSAIPGSSRDWPKRLLAEFGRVKLLLHAFGRLDQLDRQLQSDVRQVIGWTVSREELEQDGEKVQDMWVVTGQWLDDEDRIRTQRSWLIGRETRRTGLVLQFSAGGQPFPEAIVPGSEQRGVVVFYPGAARQRAKFHRRDGTVATVATRIPGAATIGEFLESITAAIARQPWLTSFCAVLHDVTLVPRDDGWFARDTAGHALPLRRREYWRLLALTGGRAFDLTGEWDGQVLRPLGLLLDGNYRIA